MAKAITTARAELGEHAERKAEALPGRRRRRRSETGAGPRNAKGGPAAGLFVCLPNRGALPA